MHPPSWGGVDPVERELTRRRWLRQALALGLPLPFTGPFIGESRAETGTAKVALVMHHARVNAQRASELINQNRGSLRAIIGDIDPRD